MTDAEPSELIDQHVEELGDWRGDVLTRVRALVHHAAPDVTEAWKWRGVPTWELDRTICTGETYADKVKLTFTHGASLDDPSGLFNASLDGGVRRAIDLHEGDELDGRAFVALVREAAGLPRLLSGENPQVPKGDGPEALQGYLDAMPGWKREVGRHLHGLVVASVPDVEQAVRWNSPFYGVEGHGWIISFHCITKYIKVTFFSGAELEPPPPETSKEEAVRYLHVHEDEAIDDAQVTSWIAQASRIDGWIP